MPVGPKRLRLYSNGPGFLGFDLLDFLNYILNIIKAQIC